MEVIDKRKVDEEGAAKFAEPEEKFDDFQPTLSGFQPLFDAVLLRELKLPPDSIIVAPDAFAEECLYCEVIEVNQNYLLNLDAPISLRVRDVVRVIKGVGTTVLFSDTEPGQRYFTVNAQDIIGKWAR
jgi:hypothetical protein